MTRLNKQVHIVEQDYDTQQEIENFLKSHGLKVLSFKRTVDYLQYLQKENKNKTNCIVLSDPEHINNLCDKIQTEHPKSRIIICSKTDIHEYSELLQKYSISSFISQFPKLWLWDLYCCIKAIQQGTHIHLSEYFQNATIIPITLEQHKEHLNKQEDNYIFETTIKSFKERKLVVESISNLLFQKNAISKILTKFILNETTFNACIRAPVDDNDNHIFQEEFITSKTISRIKNKVFSQKEQIVVQFGVFNDNLILSCKDFFGSLPISEILYRINRHLNQQKVGQTDAHGRGIVFVSEYSDKMFFNLYSKHFTEIIVLKDLKRTSPHRTIITQYL